MITIQLFLLRTLDEVDVDDQNKSDKHSIPKC
jgi:hypothetical protein